jgi:hypothetical protein
MPKTMMIGSLSDCPCAGKKGTSGSKPMRAGRSHRGAVGEVVVLEGTRGLSGVGKARGKPDMICKVNRRGHMVCRSARRKKRRK